MIKYLGSIGAFIRLNDRDNKTYTFLNVYSSSATNLSLFSASVNNSSGAISFNSASTVLYINGVSGSVVSPEQWNHVIFSFNNKLSIDEGNNFIIRFGNTASSNFNIQNLYILEQSFSASSVGYLHEEFTGDGGRKIRINDSASYSLNIIDSLETNFVSATTNTLYQPLVGQRKYLLDLDAVSEESLSRFVSASTMQADDLYIDAYNISPGSYVLSLNDNQIYQLTSSSKLTTVSSSVGNVFNVLYGKYLGDTSFIKTASGFQLSYLHPKIDYYLNIIQTNNV